MFCKFCGTEMPSDSAHCPKCGKEVRDIVPVEESKPMAKADEANVPPPPPPPPHRKKGLVTPIIILLIAASGWLYIIYTNSIEGMLAWFTSYNEMNNSLNSNYVYHNDSADEIMGNILLLVIMVLFTALAVIGLVMLVRRLIRKFVPKKRR